MFLAVEGIGVSSEVSIPLSEVSIYLLRSLLLICLRILDI